MGTPDRTTVAEHVEEIEGRTIGVTVQVDVSRKGQKNDNYTFRSTILLLSTQL